MMRKKRKLKRLGYTSVACAVCLFVGLWGMISAVTGPPAQLAAQESEPLEPPEPPDEIPDALDKNDVPFTDTSDFIKNKKLALVLGKSFFWDTQSGSDGKTACATCHFHAYADSRTRNTIGPRDSQFRGANYDLTDADFPFHKKVDPHLNTFDASNVASDTTETVGSQGVVTKNFLHIHKGSAREHGKTVSNPVFNVHGINTRQSTARNTPTAINAGLLDRIFWDGRANRFFNGVNPFGDTDPDARVWSYENYALSQVKILLDNAATASQAVGPIRSDVEMIWKGRPTEELGRKLLPLYALDQQWVHPKDSVLGPYTWFGKGLAYPYTYKWLIRRTFHKKWWGAKGTVDGKYTQMEANFTLFWGLAIMEYVKHLISDDAKFDKFRRGETTFTSQERQGLDIFMNEGKCIACHKGPAFTTAAVSELRGNNGQVGEMIEEMRMANGPDEKFYDSAFYNIGVTKTSDDLGAGGNGPFGPFSLTRRVQQGQSVPLSQQSAMSVPPGDENVAVDGAFKTPSLRNVELTGPYMHNGGMWTLEQVVNFYVRGTNFRNAHDKDPDVGGIRELVGDQEKIDALIAFLKTLTDERVRHNSDPFDHPQIIVPNGHKRFRRRRAIDNNIEIRETGKNGGKPIKSFARILTEGRNWGQ